MTSIKQSLTVRSIGPLKNIDHEWTCRGGNSTVIYARNGSGKTFISRVFRLAEKEDAYPCDRLITFGEHRGSFLFSLNDSKNLMVDLSPGGELKVTNETDFHFHVFNSDYVNDTVVKDDFRAPNVSGYIVGAGNVDVATERAEVGKLRGEIDSLDETIASAVDSMKGELKSAGVSVNTKAFKELTAESVITAEPAQDEFDACFTRFTRLKAVPDDDPPARFEGLVPDEGLLNDIRRVLSTEYSRANFAKEFIERVDSRRGFIEQGMSYLSESDRCPFCGQIISGDAATLIHQYEEYLAAEEAKARAEIASLDERLQRLDDDAARWGREAMLVASNVSAAISTYPSLVGTVTPRNPGPDDMRNSIRSVCASLREKDNAIDAIVPDEAVGALEEAIRAALAYQDAMGPIIESINDAKAHIAKEKNTCRDNLCAQARIRLRKNLDGMIQNREATAASLTEAENRLHAAEERNRVSKRDIVAKIFGELLSGFFGDKYTFDPSTFVMSLGNHQMTSGSTMVLSDGEKTIVAFCYYVASTVDVVRSQEDWGRLFFVIDDPISSLDYDYVYTMVATIRDLKGVLGFGRDSNVFLRLLILTHNYSFFNLLMTNGVPKARLILEDGVLRDASADELFPFEEHLADVIRVAEGSAQPGHTTGNSVRHVIEWAVHIKDPSSDSIRLFLQSQPKLAADPEIYALCNDFSHGRHERETADFRSELKRACEVTLAYMDEDFPGQVANVRKQFLSDAC